MCCSLRVSPERAGDFFCQVFLVCARIFFVSDKFWVCKTFFGVCQTFFVGWEFFESVGGFCHFLVIEKFGVLTVFWGGDFLGGECGSFFFFTLREILGQCESFL